ncbi:uncharacterized protein BDZ83DRAFT_655193 [Colletotrichum acutatum]|uniref:Uncharacterized protein n=1 Tax=Glomerella acutata TaxID=27357 RepID=A0AAD8XC89_GLOAC|nr:uncharacterized protein BDZ83DRAFT_655193 [Colletotrichum acutatum]KAK1718031.1 hypothetical protein BDZ83DRAFT_655193 [Colletotrichum acutatum]
MTTLQRPGWTPMAQIPPDQTNRGGDGWRGLDWWNSPTRVTDTPVCTRLSSLPTGRLRVGVLPSNEGVDLQVAMDGGMRLATGGNVSSSTFVYICFSLWRTKSPTSITRQNTYTIPARTAATVRDRSVCSNPWTTVKDCDRPAVAAAQDSVLWVRSAYDDGTGFRPRALEQLAMGIQDDYQSASITITLRRQARILLRFQLSSETPSFSAQQSALQ